LVVEVGVEAGVEAVGWAAGWAAAGWGSKGKGSEGQTAAVSSGEAGDLEKDLSSSAADKAETVAMAAGN